MRSLHVLVILVGLALFGAVAASSTSAGSATGAVEGVVFHDLNENGILEDTDVGLGGRTVTLKSGDTVVGTATSTSSPFGPAGGDGAFAIPDIAPGDYQLEVDLDLQAPPLCVDSFGSFDPFRVSGCFVIHKEYFAATTPESIPVTVTAGGTVIANFGGQQRDIYFNSGIAILNDDYASVGTSIEAFLGGTECGSSEVGQARGEGNYTFSIDLLGDAERPGCPGGGDKWHFRVGGVMASETLLSDSDQGFDRLTAMPDHAWFWAEGPLGTDRSGLGTVVQARVGNVLCGEAIVTARDRGFGEEILGFTRLVVPSDQMQAGCGQPGAVVSFSVAGGPPVEVEWEPGVNRLEMAMPGQVALGDNDCDGSRTAVDALQALRLVAGLLTGPLQGCPSVFDVNCDLEADAVDALVVLRYVAGLPTSIPLFCPVFPQGGL